MKIKVIATLFKRNKRLIIYNTPNGEQWLCNGVAMYAMRGMPRLTAGMILRIFDIPPDKHDEWICEESEFPLGIDCRDNISDEITTAIEPMNININYYGNNYWLFPDARRIYSINEDYIKPLLDEPEYLTYHKRVTAGGGFMLACKVGFELRAIIMPILLHHNEKYMNEIERITALYKSMEFEDVIDSALEMYTPPDDAPPKTDASTGEIIDGQSEFGAETV